MPRRKNKRDVVVAGQEPVVAATAADSAADGAPVVIQAGLPDTAATRAVWAALNGSLGASAAELAEAAGVGRSTATRVLAALEQAGLACRARGGLKAGGRVLPDRWRAVAASSEAEEPEPADGRPVATPPSTDPSRNATVDERPDASDADGAIRLRPGALREMVLSHLCERPDQELSPTGIGRALGHSAGAVANACESLAGSGLVTRTSEKPRRYQAVTTSG